MFPMIDVLVNYNLDRRVVNASILASLGYFLVHAFSATIIVYLQVSFPISSTSRMFVPVSQPYFVISMKQLKS